MERLLKSTLAAVFALALGIGMAGGASAQGGVPWGLDAPDPVGSVRGSGAGGDVQKTFEVTLTGDVPEGEVALAVYETNDPDVPGGAIIFCGPAEFEAPEPCTAGTYTSEPVTLAAGTEVGFAFAAGDPESDGPRFTEEGTETITADTVNAVTFDYGGGGKTDGGGTDDGQVDNGQGGDDDGTDGAGAGDDQQGGTDDGQDDLPTTGGAMPVGVPAGGVAGLGLLLAAGYTALRRR